MSPGVLSRPRPADSAVMRAQWVRPVARANPAPGLRRARAVRMLGEPWPPTLPYVAISALLEATPYLDASLSVVSVSSALEAAIEAGNVYWLVTLEDSSAVLSEQYAETPYASAARGFYQARLASVDAIETAAGDRRYALEGLSFGAQLLEGSDQAFSRIVAARPHLLRNCAATVWLASPDVDPNGWWSFVGKLLTWEMGTPGAWRLRFGVDDLPLRRKT